jgi:hypothetical protein
MKIRACIFYMFFIMVAFASCIKSFVPDVPKYDEAPVVDGAITDAPGPYTVKLSKSSRLQELSKFNAYRGCKVMIEDDLGNKTTLTEHASGVYQTDSAALQGIPGRSYKLTISTPEGETYASAPELLLKGLGIKSVYKELEHKSDPNLFYGRDGYQFYVDAETPPTTNNYILWRAQCTYKFQTDFNIICYYDHGVHPVFEGDTFKTCYRTLDILELYLLNTNDLRQQEIKGIALNYEDNYTKALTIRYSLKVSQFTLNQAAFIYWSTIKKMMSANGELYTTQPYQPKNNLRNITHPDKPILGYFTVAGLSEKRIFVNHPPIINRVEVCEIGDPQPNVLKWFVNTPSVWPVYYANNGGSPYYLSQECVDCRVEGTQAKPSFWEE